MKVPPWNSPRPHVPVPVLGLVVVAVAWLVLPSVALAQDWQVTMVVSEGYFWSEVQDPSECPVDSTVVFLGLVSSLGPILESFEPEGEVTIYIPDLVCLYCYDWDAPFAWGPAWYTRGTTLEVYDDPSRDADPADPETFRNGTLLLEGELTAGGVLNIYWNEGDPIYDPESYRAFTFLDYSGGSLFPMFSQDGAGYRGILGGIARQTSDPGLLEQNLIGEFQGELVTVIPPVATNPTTWGRIKQMY